VGTSLLEILRGARQQVRGGDRFHSAAQLLQQQRRETLADEGRAACPRENDAQIRPASNGARKPAIGSACWRSKVLRAQPALRLLRDLARGPQGAGAAQGGFVQLQVGSCQRSGGRCRPPNTAAARCSMACITSSRARRRSLPARMASYCSGKYWLNESERRRVRVQVRSSRFRAASTSAARPVVADSIAAGCTA
jgi:hypothetical protein